MICFDDATIFIAVKNTIFWDVMMCTVAEV
jgi:hypothetical protein